MGFGFFRPAKKQKNTLKWSVFLVSFFLTTVAVAQTPLSTDQDPVLPEDLVVVPTQTVQPLQIIVNDPEPGLPFSGEILSRRFFEAEQVIFSLYNNQGVIEWEDFIELRGEEVRVVPFYFPDVTVQGTLKLVIKAEGAKAQTVAMGERPVDFPFGTETTKLKSASVNLEEDNTARVTLTLEGGAFNETLVPQVKIYKERRTRDALFAEYDDLPIKITPKSTQSAEFKVPDFLPTGLYVIDVGLTDFRTKEDRGAYYTETIFSPGDYLRVTNISVEVSPSDNTKVDVDLTGIAFLEDAGTILSEIEVFDGADVLSSKAGEIDLKNGYFAHTLQFSLAEIRPDFTGEIKLRSAGGKVLATQEFLFDALTADLFEGVESLTQKQPDSSALVVEPEVKKSGNFFSRGLDFVQSNLIIVVVIAGGFMVIMLIFVLLLKRRHHVWWVSVGGLALGAPWLVLSYELPFYPTVEWVQPNISALSAYNPDSETGFAIMPVEGRLYNGLTGQGFFDLEVIREWRINFIDDQGRSYQFSLKDDYLADNTLRDENISTGYYRFQLDLSKFESRFPLGASEAFEFSEGDWRTQLLFKFFDENESVYTWYATDYSEDLSKFTIDRTPPEVQIEYLNSDGENLEPGTFTNKPVTIKIACGDEFSDCLWDQKAFEVKGNFCADGTLCNNRAAREIKVCDLAQNCQTNMIEIDYYDPIPPTIDFFNLNGSLLERASSEYEINLRTEEPRKVEDNLSRDLFDSHVCAAESSGYFLNKTLNQCFPMRYPCIFQDDDWYVRGHDVGKGCVQECPDGFEYQNGSCQVPCNNESFLSGKICFPFQFTP